MIAKKRKAAIEAMIKTHPDASNRRLAMLLFAQHGDLFASVEHARSALRYRLGKLGEKSKKSVDISKSGVKAKQNRAASKAYAMPKSKAKPWLPYEIKKPGVVAVLGDLHFPKHHEKALQSAVDHIKGEGDVDIVLLNGDVADAEEFGSWAKSPKAINTEDAVQCVRDGLLWIRSEFPNAQIIYKLGNHEERLDRYCWSRAPELVGLAHITWEGLLKIGSDLKPIPELEEIIFVAEQRPVMLGKLPVFHGHELPRGLTNAVNPARGAFLRMIDTVLINHHHRSSSHVEYDWRHHPINCWSVGCLCDLTPEYARINKWNHGFAVVEIGKSQSFNVGNYKHLHDGEIVMA